MVAGMSTLSDRIHSMVTVFAAAIAAVVRDDIAATISDVLQPTMSSPPSPTIGTAKKVSAGPRKGGKRTPAQIDAVTADALIFIGQNPGSSVEQVKKALKRDISEVVLPIQKLLANKSITKKGEKRATRYYPAPRIAKAVGGAMKKAKKQ